MAVIMCVGCDSMIDIDWHEVYSDGGLGFRCESCHHKYLDEIDE